MCNCYQVDADLVDVGVGMAKIFRTLRMALQLQTMPPLY